MAIAPTIPHHCTDEFLIGCRDLAREHGLRSIDIRVKGPGSGRESAIQQSFDLPIIRPGTLAGKPVSCGELSPMRTKRS